MKTISTIVPLLLLGLAILSGCNEPPAVEKDAEAAAVTVYQVKGVVRKVVGTMAVIDHEDIPGYMDAMAMPFHAKSEEVFAATKPGDTVEFDYHVSKAEKWVENVAVVPAKETK